jgi:hypothetical protein
MDDTIEELAAELKAMRPRSVAPSLAHRIDAALAAAAPLTTDVAPTRRYTSSTNLKTWKWLGWRTVRVAAGLVLVSAIGLRVLDPTLRVPVPGTAQVLPVQPALRDDRSPDIYQPVTAANVLYDLKDEGQVSGGPGSSSEHRLRYRYLDTYTWKNPRNNASLKWSVPRDEIRVIPASMH